MNKLGTLVIVGSLSPCSKNVRVRGQVIGATVNVRVGATSVAGGPATWSEQTFTLSSSLNPGDKVVATQSLAGFTPSDDSAVVIVGPLPTAAVLSQGQFVKPFYLCAQCVWLYGLFPEAMVEVFSNNQPLGKAPVGDDGQVDVNLKRPLNIDDNLTAVQTGCNGAKSASAIVGGRPQQPGPLPAPTIQPPLQCDQFIFVQGITPGTQVTVTRGGVSVGEFCAPLPGLIITGIAKLRPPPIDDSLVAQQAFPVPPCNLKSPPSSPPAKVKAGNPDPPKILPPLCEGQLYVNVDDLRLGATVELNVNGGTLVFGAPSSFYRFPVPPLQANTTVTARQNTCGDPASWSVLSPITTHVGSATPAAPVLVFPANGANPIAVKPTLIWSDPGSVCNFAAAFDVQVATNTGFTSGLQNFNNVTSLSWTLATALQFQTQYFWRVKGHKGAQASAWSATFHFTTQKQNVPPPPPPPPPGGSRQYCFVEDCCPNYRKVISVTGTSYADAYNKAVAQAASTCNVEPLEVSCDSKAPPCG